MHPAQTHPPEHQLAAFNQGQLDEAELHRISAHLEECPACCGRLRELSSSDRVLKWMRRVVGSDSTSPAGEADGPEDAPGPGGLGLPGRDAAAADTPAERPRGDTSDPAALANRSAAAAATDFAHLFHPPQGPGEL